MKTEAALSVTVAIAAAAVAYGVYQMLRSPCIRCISLAEEGDFRQIVREFEQLPCDQCVEVAVEDSVSALDKKLDLYEDPNISDAGRAVLETELRTYWANLFVMGTRSGRKDLVDENLINLIADKNPVVLRYQRLFS